MPGEDIYSWSPTAANNGSADTAINWQEGQARATVNNSARAMMAAHAKNRNLLTGTIVTTGSANAQAFSSGVSYTAIPTGMLVLLKIGVTNTGTTLLNMDGIGDVTIKNSVGEELIGGELVAGFYAQFLYDGTNWVLLSAPQLNLAYGQIGGLGLSNSGSNIISVAPGNCVDSTTSTIIRFPGTFTKILSGAWVAGSGAAGMGAGLTVAANTYYHVFACFVGGSADIFFDTDVAGSHVPVGTTNVRRIGSMRTDGSGNIVPFTQSGDYFYTSAASIYGPTAGTTPLFAAGVFGPHGVVFMPMLSILLQPGPDCRIYFYLAPGSNSSNFYAAAQSYNNTSGTIGQITNVIGPPTNLSGQIYMGNDVFGASGLIQAWSIGWIDHRGKD